MQIPDGVREIIDAMYCWVNTWSSGGEGALNFFGFVSKGVLQGCPLSGLLFTWVIEPILRAMEQRLEKTRRAKVRGCADDIGAVVFEIGILVELEIALGLIEEEFSGLATKAEKTVIVPAPTPFEITTAFSISIVSLLATVVTIHCSPSFHCLPNIYCIPRLFVLQVPTTSQRP